MTFPDPSDLTCLLCVRAAKAGGVSRVASASVVYNEILANHPEYLQPLCNGFHHDVRGEGPSGDFDEVTDIAIPVYSYFADKLSCCLNSKAIATARAKMGGELSELERAALDYVETCAMKSELRFEFMLEPGDISMMNNYSILHARTAFEGWDASQAPFGRAQERPCAVLYSFELARPVLHSRAVQLHAPGPAEAVKTSVQRY